MNVTPSSAEVRSKAEELKTKILSKFTNVDVECADWAELSGPHSEELQHRGFPPPRYGVQGYILIQGELVTAEKAAAFADSEVARIAEQSGIGIQVRKTNEVWCRRSGTLEVHTFVPGVALIKGPGFYAEQDGSVTFLCWVTEPHEHEWGRLRLKPDR